MADRQSSRLLVETPLARVYDVVCRTPRSGYGALMFNSVTQIGLPRRGVFIMERCGEPVVVDTNTALVLGPDDEYRVGHPRATEMTEPSSCLPPISSRRRSGASAAAWAACARATTSLSASSLAPSVI